MVSLCTSTTVVDVKPATFSTYCRSLLKLFLSVLTLQLLPYNATADDTATPTLTLLTWEDYINPELIVDFEEQHQVKVKQIYFDTDSKRDELLGLYGTEGYDLIMVDTVSISAYQELGWITPFDAQDMPELELPLMQFQEVASICSPYYWGTTGIAYRADLVDEPITSWLQIFKPKPALQGKILMPKEADEVIGFALKALGYSMVSDKNGELEEARQLLLGQAPSVKAYSAVATETEKSQLVTGDAVALITYSGDALMLQEAEPNIEYVLPEEGGAIWADYWCQVKNSPNRELAKAFLRFINSAENAAENTEYVYGATPNKAALQILSDDLLNNPLIYPDAELLKRSEPYQKLPPRLQKIHNQIMSELSDINKAD